MRNYIITALLLCHVATVACYRAICIVPVANLCYPSLFERYGWLSYEVLDKLYETMPGAIVNNADCLRIHQLLFHEVVDVIERNGAEVCIEIKNAFYQPKMWDSKQRTYWTLERYLMPIDSIANNGLLPDPIDLSRPESLTPAPHTIFTLRYPFYDEQTGVTYSVRTRFRIMSQDEETVTVACYDLAFDDMRELIIPQEYGVVNESLTEQETIKEIVDLLKEWATQRPTFACIRGGCSATQAVDTESREVSFYDLPDGSDCSYYDYPDYQTPYTGFDMPGLFMSACQIFHAPFFAKNTLTIERFLRPLKAEEETIQVGDLVVLKGYVGMVADLEKNLIIEARGRDFHSGSIRMVPLLQTFQNVSSYGRLLKLYQNKRTLTLTTGTGLALLTSPFKIVKLASIFDEDRWLSF